MKYRLKDKELQKKLEEIGGKQNVEKAISEYEETNFGGAVFAFSINDKFRITVGTIKDEIEKVAEYNPHAWNKYPEVTPPDGEFMRLEFDDGFLTGGTYDSNYEAWRDSKGLIFPEAFIVKRFRPWDD